MNYSQKYRPDAFRLMITVIGLSLLWFTPLLLAEEASTVPNSPAKVATEDVEQKTIHNAHAAGNKNTNGTSFHDSVPTVLSNPWLALAMVIGLILLAAWLFRKFTAGGNMLFGSLPILQVLGRTHLSSKQTLALIKLDNKLLLIGITDHAINTLTTIDNAEEVSHILTLIEQNRPAGITGGFKNLFSHENSEFDEPKDPSSPISLDSSDKNADNGVFQLKNELNTLLKKIQRMKGNGG
jgi:flagellar protein FliO/FliZ